MTLEDDTASQNEENIKALRKKAEQADDLQAQVSQLTQQLAIRDSKIDTGNPAFELFQRGYDGEWSPEALNAAAEKYGLLKQETAPAQQQQQTGPPASQQSRPGMEFTDQQVAWLQSQGISFPGADQQGGMQSAGDLYAQHAAVQGRMDAAQSGGQTQNPGTLSNDDWKTAGSKEEFLARYQQAGGVVIED